MQMILTREKVWKTITTTAPDSPETEVAAWTAADESARAFIALSVEDNQLSLIMEKNSAKEMWKALQEFHEKSTIVNKMTLMRQMFDNKMTNSTSMEEHIETMTSFLQKLTGLGMKSFDDEELKCAILLSSLPDHYRTLVTSLESRDKLTWSTVTSKLMDEDLFRTKNDSKEKLLKATAGTSRLFCKYCKRTNHSIEDCRTLKAKNTKNKKDTKNKVDMIDGNTSEGSGEMLLAISPPHQNDWIVDSGATSHFSNNRNIFNTFEARNDEVTVANGHKVKILGIGNCKIALINDKGKTTNATLTDVLYTPELHGNFISTKNLAQKKVVSIFYDNKCELFKNEQQIAVAYIIDDLYILKQRKLFSLAQSNKCIHHWHRVLGHRDIDAIKTMINKNLADGIKVSKCNCGSDCEVCIAAKMTRKPFVKDKPKWSKDILDIVYSDLCGPLPTQTPGGKRYILTFIDEYSRYTEVYLLREKSEVNQKMREYIELMKTQKGKIPKIFNTDRGGEYVNHELRNYLRSLGIKFQYTAPETPQLNGIAERKNRYLLEMIRCMLRDADLPNTFWGEATMTANYLQNRIVTRSINTSPYEIWNKRKPNLGKLNIFGADCYVKVLKNNRRKLDDTSVKMIFLGYDENNVLKCYNRATNKVVYSRDVQFIDNNSEISFNTLNTESQTNSNDVNIHVHGADLSSSSTSDDDIRKKTNPNSTAQNAARRLNRSTYYDSLRPTRSTSTSSSSSVSSEYTSSSETVPVIRVSNRKNKGVPPNRYGFAMCYAMHSINSIAAPNNFNQAMDDENKAKWIEAMHEELNSLKKNQTWTLCKLPSDRKAVGSKWIYAIKTDENGDIIRYKARLVAQGYSQKIGLDYNEIFAPVAKQTTLRILLSIASNNNMIVKHLDVKTAFLNGKLKETIYMKQPQGFEVEGKKDFVCLLNRSLYGLKQAPKSWNDELNDALIKMDFKRNRADPCLYRKVHKNGEECILLIYVDDILLVTSTTKMANEVKKQISDLFEIRDLGEVKYYLGIQINKVGNVYKVNQEKYIKELLVHFNMNDAHISKTPIDASYGKSQHEVLLETNADYQKLIGSLIYIAINTRPDIAAAICILSQKIAKPSKEDWNQLKKVLKYLKGTSSYNLSLANNEDKQDLFGFADANYAEDRVDRKSNSGYVFKLNGGTISWSCRKQQTVSLSSAEAELIALCEAAREALWIRNLLNDIERAQLNSTTIYEDNQSCMKMTENEKVSNRSKHIDVKYHFIKDIIKHNKINLQYCCTNDMLADILTKPLTNVRFAKLRENLLLQN